MKIRFAGEWADETGLQYLRSRYLNRGIGRLTTRDTWAGDYNRPLSPIHGTLTLSCSMTGTYNYNAANRMKTLTQGAVNYSYVY